MLFECSVKYETHLEDGTFVSKSEGAEFTVRDGTFLPLELYFR